MSSSDLARRPARNADVPGDGLGGVGQSRRYGFEPVSLEETPADVDPVNFMSLG